MNLDELGWKTYSSKIGLDPEGFKVGRVAVENKSEYKLFTSDGEVSGILRGKVLAGLEPDGFPKVGDWVRFSKLPETGKVVIEEILPRVSKISRKSPQDEHEQVIVANVDAVVIVQSLPDDFNLRRLERYLVIARQSGAQPIVVINKIDLHDEYLEAIVEAKAIAPDAPVVAVSAQTKQGLEDLRDLLKPGMSFVLLGSSGVGKSSIINAIIGEDKQVTRSIRDYDGRGRHTTTRREMILLPSGAILIDTPGMREVALWADESEINRAFEDVDDLALQCRFSNCDHDKSDGCAIKAALDDGRLEQSRYQGYLKMIREAEYLAARGDKQKERARNAKTKSVHKIMHNRLKQKYKKD
jgi:ribosome biogenesis GTPase